MEQVKSNRPFFPKSDKNNQAPARAYIDLRLNSILITVVIQAQCLLLKPKFSTAQFCSKMIKINALPNWKDKDPASFS